MALMVSRDTTVTIRVIAHAIPEEKSLIQKTYTSQISRLMINIH